MSKHAIQLFVNMFTGGTSSLTQLCICLLVQSFYLLWIFKGTGNYILDFVCLGLENLSAVSESIKITSMYF